MRIGDCEVWITCEGTTLPEYGTESEADGKLAGCFIPSEAGKHFAVHWRNSSTQSWGFNLSFDGTHQIWSGSKPGSEGRSRSIAVSPTLRRPYQFSPAPITDPDGSFLTAKLGIIEVTVKHLIRRDTFRPKSILPCLGLRLENPLRERPHKVAHRVSFGDPKEVKPKSTSRFGDFMLDHSKEPIMRFSFRYRPLALLQAQGIAPPSHPVPQIRSTPPTPRTEPQADLPPQLEPQAGPSQRRQESQAGPSQRGSSVVADGSHGGLDRTTSAPKTSPIIAVKTECHSEAMDVKPYIDEDCDGGDDDDDEDEDEGEDELSNLKSQLIQILHRVDLMEKKRAGKASIKGKVKEEKPHLRMSTSSTSLGTKRDVVDLTLD